MNAIGLAGILFLTAAADPQPASAAPAAASPAPVAPVAAAAPATGVPAAPVEAPLATPAAAPVPLPHVAVLPAAPAEGPDVELHVPRAEVAKLSLDVENLQAKLDVDTSVAQLVTIRAGVVATVQKLKAELEGVSAETHLVVRLNRVSDVLQRALAAIDGNPQLAGTFAPFPATPGTPTPTGAVRVDATAEPRPASMKPSTE